MNLTVDEVLNIAKTAAIAGGGFWAVWTFSRLQKVRTAQLENEARLSDLLRKQPNLSAKLEVRELPVQERLGRSFLTVLVALKNEGTQNADVWFNGAALAVGQIGADK